jgi:hypothetical protein
MQRLFLRALFPAIPLDQLYQTSDVLFHILRPFLKVKN